MNTDIASTTSKKSFMFIKGQMDQVISHAKHACSGVV